MKKIILSSIFFLLCLGVQAQHTRGLKGDYDVSEFPKVSFVMNSPNPEKMGPDQFALFENDKLLHVSVEEIPIDSTKSFDKSILVLWEDMASHNNQSNFTRQLLNIFFEKSSFSVNDRFNVAVFNRKHDSNPNVLTPLLDKFTIDGRALSKAVSEYSNSNEYFSTYSQQSDLYLAINEGIDMLENEPVDRTGIIVVVTAGLNVKAAGANTEMESVRQKAFRKKIPIYVIKYPFAGDTPEINSLARGTFGLVFSSVDSDAALNELNNFYSQFDKRISGHDYKITFVTETERDGKIHPLRLEVNRVDRKIPPYKAPSPTFGMWISKNILLVVIFVIVLAGIIVAIVLGVQKTKRKREKHDSEMLSQMEQQRQESEWRNREAVEAVEAMRREQETKELATQREKEERARIDEEERLTKLMQTKNLFPRLQCKTGNTGFSYTISKPRVTLGRNADNDVALTTRNDQFDNMTVSGHHAEIVFNGSAFEVVNVSQSYTQGIIVNGMLTQRHTLRSGDMIGLGEAIITFYL